MLKGKILGSLFLLVLAISLRSDSWQGQFPSLAYSLPPKRENITTSIARRPAEGKKPNRLIKEKSPYLLQHAFNPVDWYPWGEEAFAKARREDKPIFLSIGYSTCYWCHVMERQVFENKDIAAIMNKYFISIKVDREERPDVDRVYMAALQAMTGSGGWPMSLFLTPDLKPFFGGTYFPPDDFKIILQRIPELWAKEREKLSQSSNQIIDLLQGRSSPKLRETHLAKSIMEEGFEQSKALFDKEYGGFGNAPKFPRPVELNFLLRYYQGTKNRDALDMALHTLKQMTRGGIHDHIGGGFHRYSTDRQWRVPHFEKMLYDQAQLAKAYLEAYQITHEQFYAETARDILDYVLRVMTSPEGGFDSAEDAESAIDPTRPEEKEEGAFYVWRRGEIEQVLGKDAAKIFNFYYGVKQEGNVLNDPHKEFIGENILYIAHTLEETAKEFNQPPAAIKSLLEKSRKKLFNQREKRLRPYLDDKILVSWNGLMISAYARAYQILQDKRYLAAAQIGAEFIMAKLYSLKTGELLHRYRDGESRYNAYLDDYAFFTMGLLDLHEASQQRRWLDYAISLTETQERLFWDTKEGGFFDTSGKDKNILIKTKEDYDGVEPTGNSIAVLNLLRLSQLTGNKKWRDMADKTLRLFAGRLQQYPQAMPQMLVALDFYFQPRTPVATSPLILNTSADKVEVSTKLSVNKVHPGAQFQAAVILDIKKDWHINAHIPTYEFLIGTKLELESFKGVEILEIHYPKAKKFKFSFAEDILDVYAGRAPILINLKLAENFPQRHHSLKGLLHVQACNDQSCLAPSTINVVIPFEVVGFDQPITLNKSDLFSTPVSSPTLDNEIARLFKSKGTLLALLGIFILGLALNLTPCVYPMLAVTASIFSAQSHSKAIVSLFKAVVYVLGIATMYTALGVMAAFSGGIFGGMLQNPWVLAGRGDGLFFLSWPQGCWWGS